MARPPSIAFLSIIVFALALKLIAVSCRTVPIIEPSKLALGKDGMDLKKPVPTPWPEQFHALLVMNHTKKTELQTVDLWYDWPNGRNLNLIQHQYGKRLHDVEWNNGTSYYYTLGIGDDGGRECRVAHFEVGILRPNFLAGANYLGQARVDGFLCNVWEKVDFIWYYEDVVTKRPVHWLFFTGMSFHVMTFEVGVVLEDSKWQAPPHCFGKKAQHEHVSSSELDSPLRPLMPFVTT